MPRISDERRAARAQQILEAAWICFQRQGLHLTTMDDIIRASGLSAGAVYSYFPSKEELIFAAVTTSLSGVAARIEPLLARRPLPPPPVLAAEIAGTVTAYTVHDHYDLRRIALLGWAEAQRNERLRTTMAGFYGPFRARLAEAAAAWQADGLLPGDARPDAVATTLLATILGFVTQSALLGDISPDDIAAGLHGLSGTPTTG